MPKAFAYGLQGLYLTKGRGREPTRRVFAPNKVVKLLLVERGGVSNTRFP